MALHLVYGKLNTKFEKLWYHKLGGCIHNKRNQGLRAHIKSYTPMTLKNDYMNCKDYNLMKSLSECLYTYEFSSK